VAVAIITNRTTHTGRRHPALNLEKYTSTASLSEAANYEIIIFTRCVENSGLMKEKKRRFVQGYFIAPFSALEIGPIFENAHE
jgi:hypothetical protein